MIRQDAYGEDAEFGELVLGSGQPLEDGEVEVRIGPEEEAGLMAAGGDQVVLAGGLSSEWTSHGSGREQELCRLSRHLVRREGRAVLSRSHSSRERTGGWHSFLGTRSSVRSWRQCPFRRLHAEGDTVGRSRSSHYLLEPQAVLHGRQVSEIQRTTEEAGHGAEESEESRRSR